MRQALIYGGVSQKPQVAKLSRGVDIVIATPGRLLDLMNQRLIRLDRVGFLVLDEADRMLDMGFIRDVRKIVAVLPKQRQSLLFSATMPAEITRLANEILTDPLRIEVSPQSTPIERIDQRVYHVTSGDKTALLADILADPALSRVIVFSRTKHRANRVAEQLNKRGIEAEAIHGNKSQGARQRALSRFRSGDARVLVATDIAARGIDIDSVTHVVNYELPNEPESYVHRIGRTARAGADGIALSFCDPSERDDLRAIERLTNCRLTVIGDEPPAQLRDGRGKGDGRGNGRGNGRGKGKPGIRANKPGGAPQRKRTRRRKGRNDRQSADRGGPVQSAA
jgi:ATP-dependent RNA helicase RhlE